MQTLSRKPGAWQNYNVRRDVLTNMTQEIKITIKNEDRNDDVAMLLEVIAGEIRNGRSSGDEADCSWVMSPNRST